MPNSPGRFRAAVSVGWLVLGLAAFLYAHIKGIPAWAALPIAAAFLIEFPFYLLPAFDPARLRKPWVLALTCVLPYLIYSVPTGLFRLEGFLVLTLVVAAVSLCYAVLPRSGLTDFGFLAILAFVEISKIFKGVYLSPVPKLDLSVLGHVMLIRMAAIAILAIRGGIDIEFRFIPNAREWLTGLKWFAFLLPGAALALWQLGLWKLRPIPNIVLFVPEFIGILWVVAISEEFFFRGLLQQWLERWTKSWIAGLLLTTVLFGCSHLAVQFFPNWRYSLVAGILGFFCGLAWRETRTIQASMVTHALAAALYRVFFV